MASSKKTSLGLNLWQEGDKPRMEDFNADNEKIDGELVKIRQRTGSWTPVIQGADTPGTGTYSLRQAKYSIVGNQITCWGRVVFTPTSLGTGQLTIAGLPYVNKTEAYSTGNAFFSNKISNIAGGFLGAYLRPNQNFISLIQYFMEKGNTKVEAQNLLIGSGYDILFTITYLI